MISPKGDSSDSTKSKIPVMRAYARERIWRNCCHLWRGSGASPRISFYDSRVLPNNLRGRLNNFLVCFNSVRPFSGSSWNFVWKVIFQQEMPAAESAPFSRHGIARTSSALHMAYRKRSMKGDTMTKSGKTLPTRYWRSSRSSNLAIHARLANNKRTFAFSGDYLLDSFSGNNHPIYVIAACRAACGSSRLWP